MTPYLVHLPDPAQTQTHDAGLRALAQWSRQCKDGARDRWVLSDRLVMVVCTEEDARTVPRILRIQAWPRTTRWALLSRLRGREERAKTGGTSRLFRAGTELVVLPPLTQNTDRPRVLGVRVEEGALAAARLPRAWLEPPRVGKLDHPALLWQLSLLEYWPATEGAHAEATALARSLREVWGDVATLDERGAVASREEMP